MHWSPHSKDQYVSLTSAGKLYGGAGQNDLSSLLGDVDAGGYTFVYRQLTTGTRRLLNFQRLVHCLHTSRLPHKRKVSHHDLKNVIFLHPVPQTRSEQVRSVVRLQL